MVKRIVNKALQRTIGYQLSRPVGHPSWRMSAPNGGRMLVAPVFIFSPARAGSTLLRAILGSHSQLYAPPEMPLKQLRAQADTRWMQTSLTALQLTTDDLDKMLWDHVLADTLTRSGKPTIVVKTPSNVLIWEQIAECWPDARYIFLLRHPAAAVASLHASWSPNWHPGESGTLDEAADKALRYMTELERARQALPGHTVRYEELTANPEKVIGGVCRFLRVPFEPSMLEYGQFNSNRFAPGLGDSSEKIRSGHIQAPTPPPPPAQIPEKLRGICAAWGYLDAPTTGAADHGVDADGGRSAAGDAQAVP